MIEGTTDYVFVKDLDGRIIAVNESGARGLGRSREELVRVMMNADIATPSFGKGRP